MSRHLLFQALDSPGWLALGGLAVLIAAGLIVRLLQFERQLVPVRVGRWLLGLRLSVVILLGLALAEPVLSWSRGRLHRGRVLVAVDISESMAIIDAQATGAEKLRWARGLGLIGNDRINERLDRWSSDFDAGKEPRWVDPGEAIDPSQRRRLAEIRRRNLDDVFQAVSKLSRQEIVGRILGENSPLLNSLGAVGELEFRVFGGTAETVTAQALTRPPSESLTIDRTDLAAALGPVSHGDETPVAGIVLLSDGRQTENSDPLAAASRLGSQSIPIFPVLIGSPRLPRDLAIVAVDAPRTVFQQDTLRLTATVRTGGFRNRPVAIRLFPADAPDDAIVQTITPTTDSQTVSFQWPAARLGRRKLVVRAEPHPEELRDDNNQKELLVNVVDDVAKVMLVDGEARWEFRFIDNALSRDERAEVEQVVFEQPFLGLQKEPFFANRLEVPDGKDAVERSVLAETDLVIVGDVSPRSLGKTAWQLLESFVGETGGTLVLVAGKKDLPSSYGLDILERLLPVTGLVPLEFQDDDARTSPTERGFGIALTPEGQRESILQFHLDPSENRRIWDALPGHLWGLAGTPRPGSTVLARPQPRGNPDTNHPAIDGRRALFVHQFYGLGQVLWLGIDSTWRWRHRIGDTYHHRFWGQLARWAARNKAVSSNASVRLGLESAEVTEGEPVVVTARWRRKVIEKFENLTAHAEFHPAGAGHNDQPLAVVPLVAIDNRPLLWRGRTTALPSGDYQVRLRVSTSEIDTDDVTANVFVHPPTSGELTNLSADPEQLADLAAASNGRLIPIDRLDTLAGLLQRATRRTTHTDDVALWNHWSILLVFFLLMTAEWVIRKVHGLP